MENHLRFRIREKIRETARAVTLVLEPLDGPADYRAGQFLTFLFDDLGPTPLRRSYSLSSAPGVDRLPAVTVKKVVNGSVSRYLTDEAPVGEVLVSLPPAGSFVLGKGTRPRDIFLWGGGSGITPLFSLLKWALHHEPLCRIVLVNVNRDEENLIFGEPIRRLAAEHPKRLEAIFLLSTPRADLAKLQAAWAPVDLRWGRLSNELAEVLVRRNLTYDPALAQFFLCGPHALMLKVQQVLGYLGFEGQVHREIFTVKQPFRPSAERYSDSRITLRRNGRRYEFPVAAGQTILEGAEAAAVALPFSCRSGICTTCSARCRGGDVEMFTQEGKLTTAQSGRLVLTCVGYPLTEEVELEMV